LTSAISIEKKSENSDRGGGVRSCTCKKRTTSKRKKNLRLTVGTKPSAKTQKKKVLEKNLISMLEEKIDVHK